MYALSFISYQAKVDLYLVHMIGLTEGTERQDEKHQIGLANRSMYNLNVMSIVSFFSR